MFCPYHFQWKCSWNDGILVRKGLHYPINCKFYRDLDFEENSGKLWAKQLLFPWWKTSLSGRIKISSGKKQTAYDMWGYILISMLGYRGKKLKRINHDQKLENQNSHHIHIYFDKLIAMISHDKPWLDWPIKRGIPPPCMIRKLNCCCCC